jgi:hypothetical protein
MSAQSRPLRFLVSLCVSTLEQNFHLTYNSMASLPNSGSLTSTPLSEEQLSLLISLSSSIAPPPQSTMNDIQSILLRISASLAQCRSSLALACSRAASDATRDDTSQVCYSRNRRSYHRHSLRSTLPPTITRIIVFNFATPIIAFTLPQ